MAFDLHPAFQKAIAHFEDRDTKIVYLLEQTKEFPKTQKILIEARTSNTEDAKEFIRGIVLDKRILDKQIEDFITGGTPSSAYIKTEVEE
jgi:hypothetical protein